MPASNDKIIECATLFCQLYNMKDDDPDLDRVGRQYEEAMSQIDSAECAHVVMLAKLMDGKRFRIMSNNPDTVRRAIELAREIGATFNDTEDDPWIEPLGSTMLTFSPSPHGRQ